MVILKRTIVASLASLLPVFGFGVVETETTQERRKAFHPVVGLWSSNDAGEWTVDGAKWSGTHTLEEAAAAGRALFPTPADSFATNASATGAFPLAVWLETPSFAAGRLSVQFNLVSGASDQTAGIVFNLQPSGEYLFARYNTREGNVALWGFAGGRRRVLARGPTTAQLPLGSWHELVVEIDAAKVTSRVGDLSLEHTLDTPVSGRVGLWTKRDSVTTFRQFSVTPAR